MLIVCVCVCVGGGHIWYIYNLYVKAVWCGVVMWCFLQQSELVVVLFVAVSAQTFHQSVRLGSGYQNFQTNQKYCMRLDGDGSDTP